MEPIAFLDGALIPASAARLPVYDLGVVGGLAVSEMLRTFRHQPFRVDAHLARLQQSLSLVRFSPAIGPAELRRRILEVVSHNTGLIDPLDDVGVIVFVTAGWNSTYVGRDAVQGHGCTVGIHTFPLQYQLWADKYAVGVPLRASTVPALPTSIVDRRIKARSRLHWHLAEQAVKKREPDAAALLLDEDGSVTETSAANTLAVIDGVIVSPPAGTVLEGVSLQVTLELASSEGLPWERRRIHVDELEQATEILLSSTPPCLLPVCSFNGKILEAGSRGPIYQKLLAGWNSATGVDLREQAACRGRS
ncbi:MAG: aminotransferase class IV [Planctomycetaceae bacterium]|nr:aminotransferase class IV [Planctomycetaceae bacterium]